MLQTLLFELISMSPGVYGGLFVFNSLQDQTTNDQSLQLLTTNFRLFLPL